MGESLNQPSRVEEEGAKHCKLLLPGNKSPHEWGCECTRRKSIG